MARGPRCIAIAAVILLAAGLRLHGVGRQSLWFDEAATVHIVGQPIGRMIELIKTEERTPPLHYFLLWGWTRLFGNSEASVRLPSAIAGTAAVFILYLLVRRLINDEAGLIAALLLAVSHYQIVYSQEARAYTLMLLLALWSCELFVRLVERPTRRREVAYIVVTAALLYAHLYGLFAIVAQHVAYLFWFPLPLWERVRVRGEELTRIGASVGAADAAQQGGTKTREVCTPHPSPPPSPARGEGVCLSPKRWLLLNLATVALFGPWIPIAIRWTRFVNSAFWTGPMTPAHVAGIYRLYAGSWLLLIIFAVFAIVGVWRKWDRRAMPLLLGLTLLPVFVPAIVAALTRPTFTDRYAIFAPTGWFALAAAGMVAIPIKRLRIVCIAIVAILTFCGRDFVYEKPDWRGLCNYVLTSMRPTDVVAINRKNNTYLLDYYIHQPEFRARGFDGPALPFTLPLPRDQHVWLILSNEQIKAEEVIARGNWAVLSRREFGPVQVFELADTTPSSATRPTSRSP